MNARVFLPTPKMNDTPLDNEEMLWSGSVSNWHYAGKWLVSVLFLVALLGTFFVHLADDPTTLWIVRGTLALFALLLIVWIRVDRSRRKYCVTNKRVSVEFGIVSKRST